MQVNKMQTTWTRMLVLAAIIGLLLPAVASALPLVWYQIGDGPLNYLPYTRSDGNDGVWAFEFSQITSDYSIRGNYTVDSDPFIVWGLSVLNNTNNPMTFSTGVLDTFFAPLTGDNTVFGSISASVTDVEGDGVDLTPFNPHIQTSTLNGTTNMGVDAGHAYHHGPGFPGQSYVVPPDNQGPRSGPVGTWTSMELEAKFTLSKRDVATLNGYASINPAPIPEPGTLLLLGSGLLGLAVWKRRKIF